MAADEITALLSRLSLPSLPERAPDTRARTLQDGQHPRVDAGGPAYAVFVGREPGVYVSWAECLVQVKGVAHNSYKVYSNFAGAERAYTAAEARGLTCTAEERASDIRRVILHQRMEPQDLALCLHFLDDPTSKAMAYGASRWYVVYAGLQPGVYLTYHECSFSTSGYPGAKHESFDSLDGAIGAMERALASGRAVKFVVQSDM
ncbi:hypothetical protein BD626DRAFT_548868 [Schizophyllum amplum]|uniref:Ribonuclease H1 N-terminal domain-containing protein n=1 Tax=Schizophyllum amplum TaxID=97359 RepID=A0A550CA66_9AGAR|nr:hypothetical protein BD626DRAFT_548868 [Auriculariopsis ampla]